ncbi:hypothetical protein [Streptomyces sp. NBC_01022]|uniref:hypothetical protein n=1 Tax=Streptomyces sp. NBC_01022 TaxID=2903723 RepID=UPI002DDC35C2|nr:hypothetical protein [Streptomyces sp. NBC_01022]WRZ84041.1 hypothetical protein OG316_29190 [Streptomyces sp. NBC_01022]
MYATQALTHLVPLAEELDKNKVTPGVLGFIVFAALAVGVWLLMKSMNRHMGKVDFEEAPQEPKEPKEPAGAKGAAEPAGSAKRK